MKLKQRTILRTKYYVYRVGGHCISCKRKIIGSLIILKYAYNIFAS